MKRLSSHTVKPVKKWCSCGVWQDTLLPCKHACAVYRKWKETDYNYVLMNLVDQFYTYGFVKKMFKKNIYPVSLDNVAYDGLTTPPLASKVSPGRPRKKRMRQRSKFVVANHSRVLCSNCCAPGHNKQTCTATPVSLNCGSTGHNNKTCSFPACKKTAMNCCQWYQCTLEASDAGPRKDSTHRKWKEFD